MPESPVQHQYAFPVRGLRFTNFRSFQDTGYLGIRPVNFLFGKNSSGKTTIIRSLLFFKQLVSETTLNGEVPFVGPSVDFGSYAETVFNGEKKRDITISITIPVLSRSRRLWRDLFNDDLTATRRVEVIAVLHWNARLGRAQFDSIEFADPGVSRFADFAVSPTDRKILLSFARTAPNRAKVSIPEVGYSKQIETDQELNFSTMSWLLLNSSPHAERNSAAQQAEYFSYELFRELRQAVEQIEHVGPLRDMPERAYRLAGGAIPAGSTQNVLGILESNEAVLRDVSAAMNELQVARQIQVARPAPGYGGIVVKDIRTGRSDNLADVGFGVSQVLPIIARIATARPGTLVIIEQPELHLHPDTQGRLVDVLLNLASKKKVSLFIESHSEPMLLRLRRRVAEGAISSNDVRIYVTDNGEVRVAELREDGKLDMSAFPSDFFEEDWLDSVAIARAANPST